MRLGLADDGGGARARRPSCSRRRGPRTARSSLLVAEMVRGRRELIAGLVRDPQLRPLRAARARRHPGRGAAATSCSRRLPLSRAEALRLLGRLRARAPADAALPRRARRRRRGARGRAASASARLARGAPRRRERRPESADRARRHAGRRRRAGRARRRRAARAPAAAGAQRRRAARALPAALPPARRRRGRRRPAIPGKFGFVALHNLLRFGYRGRGLPGEPRRRRGARRSRRLRDVAEVPEGAADLVFVCTPNQANVELLRACAKRGVRAAFVASARLRRGRARGPRARGASWSRPPTSSAWWWRARTGRA